MFEVEYLWNGRVKKDKTNANLVYYDSPNVRYSHLDNCCHQEYKLNQVF